MWRCVWYIYFACCLLLLSLHSLALSPIPPKRFEFPPSELNLTTLSLLTQPTFHTTPHPQALQDNTVLIPLPLPPADRPAYIAPSSTMSFLTDEEFKEHLANAINDYISILSPQQHDSSKATTLAFCTVLSMIATAVGFMRNTHLYAGLVLKEKVAEAKEKRKRVPTTRVPTTINKRGLFGPNGNFPHFSQDHFDHSRIVDAYLGPAKAQCGRLFPPHTKEPRAPPQDATDDFKKQYALFMDLYKFSIKKGKNKIFLTGKSLPA